MKHFGINIHWIATGAFFAGGLSLVAQVSTVEHRLAVLERAEQFAVVSPDESETDFSDVNNPFFGPEPESPEEVERVAEANEAAAPPRSDRETLNLLMERLNPSGVIQFGSDVHLLFGERRVKVGDYLSVQYQGSDYRLEVMKVDARAFMLRLNEEVISKRIQ